MTSRPMPLVDADTVAEFGPLRRAERLLLYACAYGEIAKVGLRRPEYPSEEVSVRASFLVHLLRDGLPMRCRRLQLLGAYVEGALDLGDVVVRGSLWFYRCSFDAPVMLDGARVSGSVTFAGCQLPRLLAESCWIGAELALNAGTVIDDELRLARATIGGDLDASRLELRGGGPNGPPRCPLRAELVQVGGDVRLCDGFQALGEVRFTGARVAGEFRATGHFTGAQVALGGRGPALVLDRSEIGGSLHLGRGFGAAGRVSARHARIGGDLDATGASFDRLGDATWNDGPVLVLDRARIDGALVLCELQAPLQGASFVDACAGTLVDDAGTWGSCLVLDGFRYARLGQNSPMDTVFRLDWLERQEPAHLQAQFREQPWQRLIRVLRRMGQERRAASIALRREQRLARIGRIGGWAPPALRWLPRAGHWLLGVLAGYGYRPGRIVAWLVAVWVLGAAVYGVAALQAASATATAAPTLPWLEALVHSFGRVLPMLGIGRGLPWLPGPGWGDALHWLGRAQSGFGWLAVALLVVSLAGWADRDRRR